MSSFPATLSRKEPHGQHSARLICSLPPACSGVGFRGGQYVLVSTDKGKRPYSIASADSDQHQLELLVREVAPGGVARHVRDMEVGGELTISRAKGKWTWQGDHGRALVLATDTGISAALGLIRGQQARPHASSIVLVWLVAPGYFVEPSWVGEQLPPELGGYFVRPIDAPGSAQRGAELKKVLGKLAGHSFGAAYVVGDGELCYEAAEVLESRGTPKDHIKVESFFVS